MKLSSILFFIFSFFHFLISSAVTSPDSVAPAEAKAKHWGAAVTFNPCIVPKSDAEIRLITKHNRAWTLGGQLRYTAQPADGSAIDADYNYPTLAVGINYNHYRNVDFHRDANYDFGMGQEVDYMSRLGNTLTLYGSFERPWWRRNSWELSYALNFGVGYTDTKYDKYTNVDNEMIGSHFLIYCGMGIHATYHFAHEWGVRAGLDFHHHSNGALHRPNKGSNTIGPVVALVYQPGYEAARHDSRELRNEAFQKYDYLNVTLGVGAKSLYEDWTDTQFDTPPDDPAYRTNHFPLYAAYSLRIDGMRRWARRWATGVGIDLLYGSHIGHVKRIDEAEGHNCYHSPWSVGISFKHEAYYHRLSCAMSLGGYVYRQMGHNARRVEKPFYETIGLRYTTPWLGGLQAGFNVKAHAFKADLTEAVIVLPFKLK